jgi:hypothetical protein
MAFTFFGPAFQQVRLAFGLITLLMRSYNPEVQAPRFGLFRFRSPLLSESRLIYFPPGTEMVHFPGLARTRLYIQRAVIWFYQIGFPHSDTPGSKPVCDSPGLFAAYHVLHRLLAPRHPPYALSSLTIKLTQHVAFAVPSARHRVRSHDTARGAQFAFPHCATLEQKFAVLSRYANLDIRATQCQLPSVVKDQHSNHQLPIRMSPLPAERRIGLGPTLRTIKNPASSAGRFRPLLGSLMASALERMCSKLDLFLPGICNQSHLLMSRQPGSSEQSPTISGCADIKGVYQVFLFRQAL